MSEFPYVLFESPQEAALQFSSEHLPLTIGDGKERASMIYEIDYRGQTFYFVKPSKAYYHDNCIPVAVWGFLKGNHQWIRGHFYKTPIAGFVHTHPFCDCHGSSAFSKPDYFLLDLFRFRSTKKGWPLVYLASPSDGTLYLAKRQDKQNVRVRLERFMAPASEEQRYRCHRGKR